MISISVKPDRVIGVLKLRILRRVREAVIESPLAGIIRSTVTKYFPQTNLNDRLELKLPKMKLGDGRWESLVTSKAPIELGEKFVHSTSSPSIVHVIFRVRCIIHRQFWAQLTTFLGECVVALPAPSQFGCQTQSQPVWKTRQYQRLDGVFASIVIATAPSTNPLTKALFSSTGWLDSARLRWVQRSSPSILNSNSSGFR